jgi:hypothetical protein
VGAVVVSVAAVDADSPSDDGVDEIALLGSTWS